MSAWYKFIGITACCLQILAIPFLDHATLVHLRYFCLLYIYHISLLLWILENLYTYSTAQFKLHTRVSVHTRICKFTTCKTKKLAYTCTVACNFGVCMIASEHMRHTSDTCHELHLVCHTTCVVYRYSRHVYTMKYISFAIGQHLIVFCDWQNKYACP